MTILELKGAAYDTLAQIQHLQKQLEEINRMIAEESTKQKEQVPQLPVEEV
jgi:hypothetical protein